MLLKERIRNFARGVREGTVSAKQEVAAVQKQFEDLVVRSDLAAKDKAKFLKTFKTIQTEAQFQAALPKLEERIAILEDKAVRREAVTDINKLSRAKLTAEYQDQVDILLEGIELKTPTKETVARRQKKAEFLAQEREKGNLAFVPPDFFVDLGITSLKDITTEQLVDLRDQLDVIVTTGRDQNRLLQIQGQKDLDARAGEVSSKIYNRTGVTESVEGKEVPLVPRGKRGLIDKIKETASGFFAGHRKVEFITKDLNVDQDIFKPIQQGINKELSATEKAYVEIKDIFKLLSKDIKNISEEQVTIEGIPTTMTRENMIAVVLNSGNFGNVQRLKRGNRFSQEQIRTIREELKPNELEFVDRIFKLVDSFFPETVDTTRKLTGARVKKVVGKYFPIVVDKELNQRAKFQAAQNDLFQDIFQVTFVNRNFARARKGGIAPIDLNVFRVILNHIDSVIHYNSMAIPIRDVQKLIGHNQFQKAFFETVGQAEYDQLLPWLRDIANPQSQQTNNIFEKIAKFLRHNSTAAILGHRIVVSFLQVGSITQTIKEIGVANTLVGVKDFLKDPRVSIEFVYELSPIMKNRSRSFDREIKDWLNSDMAKRLIQGKKSHQEVLFSFIRGVDFVTTMPTWLGAYYSNYKTTQDVAQAVDFADGVVRRTQPAGAMENLSQVMRGGAFQKLFTSFMTHFSNMHNQMVSAMRELKYSNEHPMVKSANFARSMFWLWAAPALFSAFVRGGGDTSDYKKYLKELILYPFAGLILIRDLMNSLVKGFDFGAPPGLSGLKELGFAFKGKQGKTKLKHGVKAVGLLTGKVPTQWVDSVEGFIDIMEDETKDFRRLVWSDFALKKSGPDVPTRTRGQQ